MRGFVHLSRFGYFDTDFRQWISALAKRSLESRLRGNLLRDLSIGPLDKVALWMEDAVPRYIRYRNYRLHCVPQRSGWLFIGNNRDGSDSLPHLAPRLSFG